MSCALTRKTDFFHVWQKFITTGCTKEVPDNIRRSWIRCSQMGVDPINEPCPEILSSEELEKRVIKTSDLRRHIQNHYRRISRETDLSQFIITFNDADGYLLSIEGHDKILQISENSILKIGSSLGESSVGTTAPGVCIIEKRPVMVYAEEHYSRLFHWACCFAVPLFNHVNEILGTLTIATTFENRDKIEQLAVVFCSIANSFQVEFFIKQKFQELELYRSYFDATFKYSNNALCLINRRGDVINMNATAQANFDTSPGFCQTQNLADFLDMKPEKLITILQKGGETMIQRCCNGQTQQYMAEIMPVFDPQGNAISYLLKLALKPKVLTQANNAKNVARYSFDNIIGNTDSLSFTINRARKAARMPSNILIEGESGTGKELFAHSIHAESSFYEGPFVAINCSAIPKELIESELFGYEKGAYTGAQKSGRIGKFEQANDGTIFLDEIHTMSLSAQMKILRVIEDRSITRVGGKNTIPLNIRIIAATSEDLDAEVADGSFLSALFFRLNVVRLQIPSLRERKNDIPLLINHFIHQMNGSFHRNISRIDPAALDMILEHCWPGNIRELKNCIESAFNFCDTETITPDCLNLPVPKPCSLESPKVKPNSLEAVNMQMISESLEQFGTVKEAAAHLDIPLSTFYRKMKSYGLSK